MLAARAVQDEMSKLLHFSVSVVIVVLSRRRTAQLLGRIDHLVEPFAVRDRYDTVQHAVDDQDRLGYEPIRRSEWNGSFISQRTGTKG